MTKNSIKYLMLAATCCGLITPAVHAQESDYIRSRYPLADNTCLELPIGAVKARGWLQEQLQRQASGMTGHLDELYPQVVGKRNAWLGGDGDTWERGPYWIDGLLPLAYLLDDEELKAKAQVWVESILSSQQENGYFGPSEDYGYEPGLQRDNSHDWWPKMVALKIIKQYYMATQDKRVAPFLLKYFRYQQEHLPQQPLGHWTFWGAQRGGDNLDVVLWLYNLTGEKFLLNLAETIHQQSTPWTDYFTQGDIIRRQNSLHCVNLAQGFKEPAVYYQLSKDSKYLEALRKAHRTIRSSIGLPTGLWAGDELTHYGSPTRGSEFCTAVEMMFSLESILRITCETEWADYLERVAYNALPTQANDDFTARQYFQQTNQIRCDRQQRPFSSSHDDTDQVFGILNGYPCCTCNMHQGWPKLVQNLWYATADEGVAALVYAPCEVKAKVGGGMDVNILEETSYPFDETIRFRIGLAGKHKSAHFPLRLRIPEWCRAPRLTLNGKGLEADLNAGQVAVLRRMWRDGDVLELELPASVRISRWYDDAAVVERGPLLYALRMSEQWEEKDFLDNEQPTYGPHYYQVTSASPWNYALVSQHLGQAEIAKNFQVEKRELGTAYPWNVENAPIRIHARGLRMAEWKEYNGNVGDINYLDQNGAVAGSELQDIELIPYGCTTLRIAEFPVRSVR